jgi:acyl-[acyl carrier protein]--UDP-N-acetylglucosamine O-acyltransferase
MSARIDPSARIEAGAKIGKDVSIGPYCTVGAHVSIGDGCRLVAHVNLSGHTTIGPRTVPHRNRSAIAADPPVWWWAPTATYEKT